MDNQCPMQGCDGSGHISGQFSSHRSLSGCPLSIRFSELQQQSDNKKCPTPGCNGLGNTKSMYTFHRSIQRCPLIKKHLENSNLKIEKMGNLLNSSSINKDTLINIFTASSTATFSQNTHTDNLDNIGDDNILSPSSSSSSSYSSIDQPEVCSQSKLHKDNSLVKQMTKPKDKKRKYLNKKPKDIDEKDSNEINLSTELQNCDDKLPQSSTTTLSYQENSEKASIDLFVENDYYQQKTLANLMNQYEHLQSKEIDYYIRISSIEKSLKKLSKKKLKYQNKFDKNLNVIRTVCQKITNNKMTHESTLNECLSFINEIIENHQKDEYKNLFAYIKRNLKLI